MIRCAGIDEGGLLAHLEELRFRLAGPADAEAVANLHADSWRRHYRGAYSDRFLDGDVVADRLAVWTDRLREPDPRRCTILAEDGNLLGFANTVFDNHPTWGALLDNLHVAHGHKRRGIGSRLLALTAEAVIGAGKDRPVPMGPRTEHRRPGLLPGPRREMRGTRSGIAAGRDRQPHYRISGEVAICLAQTQSVAPTVVSV